MANIIIFIILINAGLTFAQWWDFSPKEMKSFKNENIQGACDEIEGFSQNQQTLCGVYPSHMPFIGSGAGMGAQECKWQFQGERWNCSAVASSHSTDVDRKYDKLNTIGSKETAFTYAIASAGIVYSIARACKDDKLVECGCSRHERPNGLGKTWKWGGCGDNTEYAYGFSKEFVDAKESENLSPRKQRDRARRLMNLHNNEVGRLAVVHSLRPTCKCHGVSGSCSLKTCWMKIPDFRTIGNKLKEKYRTMKEIKVSRKGRVRYRTSSSTPKITDLVYLDSSPDYCYKNTRLGVDGTSGRECKTDSDGRDGCGVLCCGRGHQTITMEIESKCNCKFEWCCVVRCQKCKKKVTKNICN